jgi:hypothetical protein
MKQGGKIKCGARDSIALLCILWQCDAVNGPFNNGGRRAEAPEPITTPLTVDAHARQMLANRLLHGKKVLLYQVHKLTNRSMGDESQVL